eukprot:COSAG05_NODE_2987_length_2435_cov_1.360873_2_plen_95_part_00
MADFPSPTDIRRHQIAFLDTCCKGETLTRVYTKVRYEYSCTDNLAEKYGEIKTLDAQNRRCALCVCIDGSLWLASVLYELGGGVLRGLAKRRGL